MWIRNDILRIQLSRSFIPDLDPSLKLKLGWMTKCRFLVNMTGLRLASLSFSLSKAYVCGKNAKNRLCRNVLRLLGRLGQKVPDPQHSMFCYEDFPCWYFFSEVVLPTYSGSAINFQVGNPLSQTKVTAFLLSPFIIFWTGGATCGNS